MSDNFLGDVLNILLVLFQHDTAYWHAKLELVQSSMPSNVKVLYELYHSNVFSWYLPMPENVTWQCGSTWEYCVYIIVLECSHNLFTEWHRFELWHQFEICFAVLWKIICCYFHSSLRMIQSECVSYSQANDTIMQFYLSASLSLSQFLPISLRQAQLMRRRSSEHTDNVS